MLVMAVLALGGFVVHQRFWKTLVCLAALGAWLAVISPTRRPVIFEALGGPGRPIGAPRPTFTRAQVELRGKPTLTAAFVNFTAGVGDALVVDAASEESAFRREATSLPPRLRREFPETLFWAPQVITDDRGVARVEIPLADSITTWKLVTSGVSASGGLGSCETSLRVFQPFFVDLNLPVALLQNDEVTLSCSVYSYLPEEQPIRLELKAGEAFEALGPGRLELTLGPNEVTGVSFRVAARAPGSHPITLTAWGAGGESDAIERTVEIRPCAKVFESVASGRLTDRSRQEVVFPPGSAQNLRDLHIVLYPGTVCEVVRGLESLVRLPGG